MTYCSANNQVVVPHMSGQVSFCNAKTFEVKSLSVSDGSLMGVSFSPDGSQFAAAHRKTVSVWDFAKQKKLCEMRGHGGGVFAVSWHPQQARIASASVDRTVGIWDASNGRQLMTLREHKSPVQGICWSPDGKKLASVGARCFCIIRTIELQ